MIHIAVAGTQLEDIHVILAESAHLDHVLDLVAAFFFLLGRDLHFHEEVFAADFLDTLGQFDQESGAILGGAAIGIGTVIGDRRQETSQKRGAICKMQRTHIKSEALVFVRSLRKILDELRDHLRWHLLRRLAAARKGCHIDLRKDLSLSVFLYHAEVLRIYAGQVHFRHLIDIIIRIRSKKRHHRQRNLGIVVMHLISKLAEIVFHCNVTVECVHGKTLAVFVVGLALAHIGPVRKRYHGCAVFGACDHMINDLLIGKRLRSLQKMRQGIARDQTVL